MLKGAALFTVWTGHPHRATRDVDLLAFAPDPVVLVQHPPLERRSRLDRVRGRLADVAALRESLRGSGADSFSMATSTSGAEPW